MEPTAARAILLLPSGHRAYDEDFTVAFPLPKTIDVHGTDRGIYVLGHVHHSGVADDLTRGLYFLRGQYAPYGFAEARANPDEVHDQ